MPPGRQQRFGDAAVLHPGSVHRGLHDTEHRELQRVYPAAAVAENTGQGAPGGGSVCRASDVRPGISQRYVQDTPGGPQNVLSLYLHEQEVREGVHQDSGDSQHQVLRVQSDPDPSARFSDIRDAI